MQRRLVNKLPLAAAAALLSGAAQAQSGKPVSLVVGYSAVRSALPPAE